MDNLKIAVYDTYVTREDHQVMHFDILVPTEERDLEKIYGYGRDYLQTKGQAGQPLTAKECRFCHVGQATAEMRDSITSRGYFIIEMEGCE